jgi:hypothetical protein
MITKELKWYSQSELNIGHFPCPEKPFPGRESVRGALTLPLYPPGLVSRISLALCAAIGYNYRLLSC